jgi:hypothetical protein
MEAAMKDPSMAAAADGGEHRSSKIGLFFSNQRNLLLSCFPSRSVPFFLNDFLFLIETTFPGRCRVSVQWWAWFHF